MSDLDVMKPIIANALQLEQMGRHAIRTLAMRHGFALRPQEGRDDDLNEYVYSFAREVFEAGRKAGSAEIRALREDLVRERMRLVACGVVASADTPESAAKAREMHKDYRSASCDDVARCVDECMALRKERDALAAKLAELEGLADRYRVLLSNRDHTEPVNARLLEALREIIAHVENIGSPCAKACADDTEFCSKYIDALAAITAAEAQGVTGPKRLTDEEIMGLLASIDENSPKDSSFFMIDPLAFARAIEAAVLGIQETKSGD